MENSWSSNGNSEPEAKSEVDSKDDNENNPTNITPFMSKNLAAAAGFNTETPIVNALIGNLTGSLPTKKSETEMLKCEICQCELSSNIVLSFHLNGSKHRKRLKALEIIAQLKDAKDTGVQLGNNDNPNAFRCEICSLTVNSAQQLEIHLSGAKHKKKAAKVAAPEADEKPDEAKNTEVNENAVDNITPPAAKKKKKEEQTMIPCTICNVFMNSQTQYDQHLLSKKHLSRTTRKQQQQQQRKIPGRGKFAKFPPIRNAGPRFPPNNPNNEFQNEPPPFNPHAYKRLFPYSNFLTKNPFFSNCKNGDNKMNSFRKPNQFQKRF